MEILSNVTVLSNKLQPIVANTTNLITNGYYAYRPQYESKKNRSKIFEALKKSNKYPVLAELKFSTPTNGLLKDSSIKNTKDVLKIYSDSTVCGLSILTEPDFFHGSLEYLDLATSVIDKDIPILMKDFIISYDQITCAKNLGASTVLLISKILTEKTLEKLIDYTHNLNLEVLLEVNSKEELNYAVKTNVNVIGINNRNLNTMNLTLDTTEDLLKDFTKKSQKILSLSGITTTDDVHKVKKAGADGILVGSALMKSANPKGLINQFSEV